MIRMFLAGLILAAVLVAPAPALAQAPSPVTALRTQLRTAIFHAGELAQRAAAPPVAVLHVHHVMNCLEGPKGANFDATKGYPCQGQGNGVLEDLNAAQAAGAPGAEAAAKSISIAYELTKQGLRQRELFDIQAWVKKVGELLNDALRVLG